MKLYSKAARLVILDFFTWLGLTYLVLKLGSVLLSVNDTFFCDIYQRLAVLQNSPAAEAVVGAVRLMDNLMSQH